MAAVTDARAVCHGQSVFHADHPTGGLPVHPTEIYDALDNFILYLLLAWLFRRKKFDGEVFATYLVGYAIIRTIMEYFRGDYPPDQIHFGLTPGELVSIPIFIIGLVLGIVLSNSRGQEEDQNAPPVSELCLQTPIFIAGPTAVGKSEIALRLAEQLGGEIISVDSMQVYRGLDIGTAKPSPAERARVPHHLIDICDLTESFDAAQFARLAHRAVAEIQSRGRVPILCGGTGLYFKAFLEGLGEAPSADAKLRAELEATPLENLLEELRERDPAAYEKIDKKNPRRVIRAVEVIRLTGKPFSEQRAELGSPNVHTRHAVTCHFYLLHALNPTICGSGLTPAWTRCSRAVWWTRRANCSSAALQKTKRRCRPSATGRWWNICAASGHWRKPSSW